MEPGGGTPPELAGGDACGTLARGWSGGGTGRGAGRKGRGTKADEIFPRRAAELKFEVAAEIAEVEVASLERDSFDGFAFGDEVGGEEHAFRVEEFPGATMEVLLANAFELAKGDLEVPGGCAHIVVAEFGQLEPEADWVLHRVGVAMVGARVKFIGRGFPPRKKLRRWLTSVFGVHGADLGAQGDEIANGKTT